MTPPALPEPLAVSEVKDYLGVSHNAHDELIGNMIICLREFIERETGRRADHLGVV